MTLDHLPENSKSSAIIRNICINSNPTVITLLCSALAASFMPQHGLHCHQNTPERSWRSQAFLFNINNVGAHETLPTAFGFSLGTTQTRL